MREQVEIRFTINGNPTPWEPELVRYPEMGQVPTAVRRITELRQQYPSAAIATERRGDVRRRPELPQRFRYSIYVKSGTMLVNDPNGVNGVSVAQLDKSTLFSKPFTEDERDHVKAEVLKLFPNAQLTEMKA